MDLLHELLPRRKGDNPQNSKCLLHSRPAAVQIETGQPRDCGSAMPHTLSKQGSLPTLATTGKHQLWLSVKVALEEWRQGKVSILEHEFSQKLCGDAEIHLAEALWRYGTFLRKLYCALWQLSFSTIIIWAHLIDLLGREFNFFLKGNGWFHFLIYESMFNCKLFVNGTEQTGPNPPQSPWVCLH